MKEDLCKVIICAACIASVAVEGTGKCALTKSSTDISETRGGLDSGGKCSGSLSATMASLESSRSGVERSGSLVDLRSGEYKDFQAKLETIGFDKL